MPQPGNSASQSIALEEGRDAYPEHVSLLSPDEEAASIPPLFGEKLAWRLAVLGVTALAVLGVVCGSVVHRHHRQSGPEHINAQGVEQKFYDSSGAYWQAPSRGISTSELWGSCEHPHMHLCNGYCCCDAGHYWKSPKTMYQQGKSIVRKTAAGVAAKESREPSVTAAGEAVAHAAKALGKAAVASMTSSEQACVPRADVPDDVTEALNDSSRIPGSENWVACSTFTAHSHTCGDYCCCNGGSSWSVHDEACASSS